MNRTTLKARIREYFDEYLPEHEGEIADIESLAVYLGLTREELSELESAKGVGREVSLARARIASIKKQLAFKGKIPAAVLSFDFKNNHGYRDKCESEGSQSLLILQGAVSDWGE